MTYLLPLLCHLLEIPSSDVPLLRHRDSNVMSATCSLSREEQIVGFHSEQAFFYSFYEDTISADSLIDAVTVMTRDTRSQYPDVVNPIAQFNVCFEVRFATLTFRDAG